MLLLLKSPASGAAAASLGLTLGLSAIAGTTANLGITLGLTPPESIELNVFVTPDIKFGVSAISSGFLTRSATLDTQLNLLPVGGYGASPTMTLLMGLSGTVGSFLQANATPGITCGLTANPASPGAATLDTVLTISGAPMVSGGTVTPTAVLTHTLGLSAALTGLGFATTDILMDLTGTPIAKVPNLATNMRLSFEADEIRLIFRRG